MGRHIVAIAQERGHDVLVLSRSTGVDLTTGVGLGQKLDGADVVIDVTGVSSQSASKSTTFFETVTTNLMHAEKAAGVAHHLALSIVGVNKAPFGYYAGKNRQEEVVSGGLVPWTILRATQFHEFAQLLHGRFTVGPVTFVPAMASQPVAAREVGKRLVVLAEGQPAGRPADLAGPEVLRMVDMVRAFKKAIGATGPVVEFPLPGGFGTAMRNGTLLAGPTADRGSQTYAEWVDEIAREHR